MTDQTMRKKIEKLIDWYGNNLTAKDHVAQQILALFESVIPKKWESPKVTDNDTETYLDGYNRCLDDIRQKIGGE